MNKIHAIIISLFIVALSALPSYAIQSLTYQSHVGASTKIEFDKYLFEHFETSVEDYDIAQTDLNSDGLTEFILRRKFCTKENSRYCPHLIFALNGNKAVLLSNIQATEIYISAEKTYGIKNILVPSGRLNDNDFDIYVWSAEQKTYILKSE